MSVVNYTLSLETMRTWVPEAYMSGDSLGRVGRLRTVSNYFFYLMPLVLGVPQFAFNISVVASVAVLTKMRNTGRVSNSHKPAFFFIANLAMADMLMVSVELVAVHLQRTTHKELGRVDEYYLDLVNYVADDSIVQSVRKSCRIQVIFWLFTIANTLFAALMLTIDRYVYITRGLRYAMIMTSTRITMMIALTWIVPMVWVFSAMLMLKQQTDAECVAGHVLPISMVATAVGSMIVILAAVYLLYSLILVKFFRRRRMLDKHNNSKSEGLRWSLPNDRQHRHEESSCQKNEVEQQQESKNDSQKADARRRASSVANTLLGGGFSGFSGFSGFGGFGGSSGSGGSGSGLVVISRNSSSLMFRSLSSLSRFTKAAKYVLILLVAFTLAWMPWIVLLCRDILLHGTGYWEDELRRYGCFVPLPQEGSTMRLQMCIFHAFSDPSKSCVISLKEEELLSAPFCRLILEAYHAQRQDSCQKFALVFGVTNSLLNPIIYAFWYSEFRLKITKAWKSFFGVILHRTRTNFSCC